MSLLTPDIVRRYGPRGPHIMTRAGNKFFPLDPRAEEVDVKTIAWVLAGEARFGGHCDPRISVAQHSVMVSERFGNDYDTAMWGLLHDASEAYVRDLNRPIKRVLRDYKRIETRVQEVIAEKFNLSWPMPDEIHEVDNRVGVSEAKVCMSANEDWIGQFDGAKPYHMLILPWTRREAYRKFLHRFAELELLRKCHHEVTEVCS